MMKVWVRVVELDGSGVVVSLVVRMLSSCPVCCDAVCILSSRCIAVECIPRYKQSNCFLCSVMNTSQISKRVQE